METEIPALGPRPTAHHHGLSSRPTASTATPTPSTASSPLPTRRPSTSTAAALRPWIQPHHDRAPARTALIYYTTQRRRPARHVHRRGVQLPPPQYTSADFAEPRHASIRARALLATAPIGAHSPRPTSPKSARVGTLRPHHRNPLQPRRRTAPTNSSNCKTSAALRPIDLSGMPTSTVSITPSVPGAVHRLPARKIILASDNDPAALFTARYPGRGRLWLLTAGASNNAGERHHPLRPRRQHHHQSVDYNDAGGWPTSLRTAGGTIPRNHRTSAADSG